MKDNSTLESKTLVETAKDYLLNTTELCRLKAIDKAADGISTISVRVILIPFVVLFFLIMNLAVSMWLGEWAGKMSYGFFMVAGGYLFVGLLIYLFGRTLIIAPLKNAFIRYASKFELPWNIQRRQKN